MALAIYGIAVLGVVTATLASWLIQQVAEEEEKSTAATEAHVDQLGEEVAVLHALILERTGSKTSMTRGRPRRGAPSQTSEVVHRTGVPHMLSLIVAPDVLGGMFSRAGVLHEHVVTLKPARLCGKAEAIEERALGKNRDFSGVQRGRHAENSSDGNAHEQR